MRIRSGRALAILAAILVTPLALAVQSAEDGRHPPRTDWPLFGGSWANARHSTLAQINTQNVKALGAAWTMKFEGNASTRATPIVKNGVMFISAGSRLHALNAATGARRWTWRPADAAPDRLEAAAIGDLLNAGFGIANPPGVALGEGLVFVGLMDGTSPRSARTAARSRGPAVRANRVTTRGRPRAIASTATSGSRVARASGIRPRRTLISDSSTTSPGMPCRCSVVKRARGTISTQAPSLRST